MLKNKLAIREMLEKELNAKILKLTLIINDKYKEITRFIEEMPDTIPNINHPKITLQLLANYYNSLDELVKSYRESEERKSIFRLVSKNL